MTLKLRNSWNYEGKDWWQWSAFLDDGGSGELDKIKFVEYVLHETFPDPIRRIDSREDGFELKTGGWGTFELKAFVHFKDGTKKRLSHEIKLEYDPKRGTS